MTKAEIWAGARTCASGSPVLLRRCTFPMSNHVRAASACEVARLPVFAIPFPAVDPVLVSIGPFAIHWYALAYIAGIVLGWRLVRRLVQRPGWGITPEAVDDLVFYVTLGVILGGRIGYILFYQSDHYLAHPLDMLAVWRGGMSFHGGLIGVLVATFLFTRTRGYPFFEVTDALAVATPIGLFLGRIANFVNAELWGRVSDVPWAMVFPNGGPDPRHPSQLYQAALEGLLLFVVMQVLAWGRRRDPAERGLPSGVFLAGYAVCRMVAELFREPDAQLGFLFGRDLRHLRQQEKFSGLRCRSQILFISINGPGIQHGMHSIGNQVVVEHIAARKVLGPLARPVGGVAGGLDGILFDGRRRGGCGSSGLESRGDGLHDERLARGVVAGGPGVEHRERGGATVVADADAVCGVVGRGRHHPASADDRVDDGRRGMLLGTRAHLDDHRAIGCRREHRVGLALQRVELRQ